MKTLKLQIFGIISIPLVDQELFGGSETVIYVLYFTHHLKYRGVSKIYLIIFEKYLLTEKELIIFNP